jgi:hypothetical protein
MSFLDYNTIQWRRVHFACALPGCNVPQHTGSDFCAIHWQRSLVVEIAGLLRCPGSRVNHATGVILNIPADVQALKDAQQIALYGDDVSVAAFVLANMSKDMQTFLCVTERDVSAIEQKAMVAA